MDEKWNPMVVTQDPAKGFRQGVEEFRAAFSTEGEPGDVFESHNPFPASMVRAIAWLMVA